MRVFNAHIVWNIVAQNVYCEITWGTMVCFKQQIFMKTFNRSTHLLWSVMDMLALVQCDFPIGYVLHSILLAKWGKPSTRLLTWYYKWGIDSEQLVNLTNDPLAYHRQYHTIGTIENVGVKFSFQDFSMLNTSPYTFVWNKVNLMLWFLLQWTMWNANIVTWHVPMPLPSSNTSSLGIQKKDHSNATCAATRKFDWLMTIVILFSFFFLPILFIHSHKDWVQ